MKCEERNRIYITEINSTNSRDSCTTRFSGLGFLGSCDVHKCCGNILFNYFISSLYGVFARNINY